MAGSKQPPPPSPPRRSTDALGVFTFLWAQVMVLQVVKLAGAASCGRGAPAGPGALLWPAFMASACLSGVVLPGRGFTTVYLTAASILVLWFTGSQSNHVFMDMVVCISVLAAYSADRGVWQAQATHAIRLFLVVLYLVTALHKMNTDWDGPASCCTLMLAGILALPPLRWLQPLLPVAAAPRLAGLVELVLPALLLRASGPCLRLAAVLGCAFHLAICQMLSPMSVYPFSLLMAPLYVFVVPDQVVHVFQRLRPWAAAVTAMYAVACRSWTPLMADDLPDGEEPFEYPAYGFWAPGVAWCSFVYLALIGAALWGGAREGPSPAALPTWRGRLLAAAVAAFGLAPYLGLRNHPALAMFSNLRVEGGRSNHLFLRDDLDLTGWQRDYVTVHETDVQALLLGQVDLAPLFTPATGRAIRALGLEGEFWIAPPLSAWPYNATRSFKPYSMPFLEMRRRLAPLRAAGGAGHVRYTRTFARAQLAVPRLWALFGRANAEADRVLPNLTYDVAAGGDPEIEEPLPWWLALVARFRTFDVDYSPCRH